MMKVSANSRPNSTRPNMAISKGSNCMSARAILKLPLIRRGERTAVWLRAP